MEQAEPKGFGINGFTLKWIAMLTMIMDHTGMVLFPQYIVLRIIGRLAFPIYCFLLVEGAVHTSNKKRYLIRLLVFALISEIPVDLICTGKVWSLSGQNVFFTLTIGLAAIFLLQSRLSKGYSFVLIVVLILLAEYANMDYGGAGIVFILIFYMFREQLWQKSLLFAAADIFLYGGIQNYAVLSLLPILCYNGKRGPGMKYFFYLIYPVHLLILYGLKLLI